MKPIENQALFLIADKCFELAVDIIKVFEGLDERDKKFASKQLLRYTTQIGAKVIRSGPDFTSPRFIQNFAYARKRAFEAEYWLKACQAAGYLSEETFQIYHTRLNEICLELDSFLKKIRLNKAIMNLNKKKIIDSNLLKYNYN